MEIFSKNLKSLRKEKGLNQSELANNIGLRQSHISSWELNTSDPSLYNIMLLADYFNVSIDYLTGREEEDGRIIVQELELPSDERHLINCYRNLPEELKKTCITYIETMESLNNKFIKKIN